MGGRGDLNKVTEIGVELGVLNCKQHRAEIASNFFHNDLIKLSLSDRARAPRGRLVSLKTAALRSKSADQRLLLVSKFCSVLVADRFADSLSARFSFNLIPPCQTNFSFISSPIFIYFTFIRSYMRNKIYLL